MKVSPTKGGWEVESDVFECAHRRDSLVVQRRQEPCLLKVGEWKFQLETCSLLNCRPRLAFLRNAEITFDKYAKLARDQHTKAKSFHIKTLMAANKNNDSPAKRDENKKMVLASKEWEKAMMLLQSQVHGMHREWTSVILGNRKA
ncbi:MAG: hypothetical protein LQ350_005478 [Teloschistes chrysophthalmus]|nr:MAG: hypothetical protein LQ350_005478 [Niorma chrysophthalma]